MTACRDGAITDATLSLDVALTPAFVPSDPTLRERSVYIVVDVVRATTTLSVMFDRGCARVLVAPGIAAARAAAAAPGAVPYLLGGESGGVAPPGFNFGNSPREYGAAARLDGRELIFVTTNGTRALHACAGGFVIFSGAFRNATAVAEAAVEAALRVRQELRAIPAMRGEGSADATTTGTATGVASEAVVGSERTGPDIVVVCAGRLDGPTYDDTLCAGYLLTRLHEAASEHGLETTLKEGGRIAAAVWGDQQARHRPLQEALADSDAGEAVRAVGLEGDLAWCADIDASRSVPYVASIDVARNLLEVLPLGNSGAEMQE